MRRFDLSVYLVTDRPLCLGRQLVDVVGEAVAGGVTLVQLREKDAQTREFVELARAVKALLDPFGVPLLINDRVDVALACGAAGVHVGQKDMNPADVRAIVQGTLGPDAVVGLSVESEELALAARDLPVDYLGAGPVFATTTKKDAAPVIGLAGLSRIVELAGRPVVGIGAIGADNAAGVIRAGAAGVAVVSAVCSAPAPREAAARLADVVRAARGVQGS
ncbi:Thiamine-phosphate pyrophosphorylase [Desulfovibrio sp. X2]|uniref:thiamine phosphate synthase n=1 Tax=Desulfovibrio sp. X2 TaxID=941449 RepID=UPI000358972A|nr:thiamine phosphate synthase [Desulfovibrio sp. X2]EPR42653.1 Thiamine-phosphate pyrophosphorylase [Desulfovibrio sp. X2]